MKMMDKNMSGINKDPNWIEKVCVSACIRLTDEERSRLATDMGNELRDLSEVPFEGILERWQERAVELESLRRDQSEECLNRAEMLAPSASHNDACFLVPKVLGSEEEKS